MSALTLKLALNLASQALAAGRQIAAAPLAVAVLDGGGHLVALQREDGASLLRPSIAIGKAWGAIALGWRLPARWPPNRACWRWMHSSGLRFLQHSMAWAPVTLSRRRGAC